MVAHKILIVDEIQADSQLEERLSRYGYEVACLPLQSLDICRVVLSLLPDVIVMNLYSPTPRILDAILEINRSHPVPVIVFAEDQETETINRVIKAGISAYIVDGYEAKRINAIVEIAIARFKEHQSLKTELEQTKTKLVEHKLIDRAKGLLIQSRGFTEDQAYHTLRKLAMDRNITIGEMARNVISMADLLK